MTKISVGAFSIEEGVVTGPADYMTERGNDRLRQIEAGQDVVFNTAMGVAPSPLYAALTGMDGTPLSPDPETAILVSLQTDYAGFRGEKTLPHDCEDFAVPYVSDGPLGHGFECGRCGRFLQAG